ncbi:pyridoxamine 5'-phosphate oxidase family protein [Polaribacter sp. HL-MS24]|nr:pyridoxamine 5'-phosphate oxidase family protein [Polaribacter sp. HL-MS24]WOC39285.1 pyridoxamine 5'-phosphate oxidase family protein [Polaribacter sp. HL-MS24]
MELTTEIKQYVNRSVLCWLATVSTENVPNVSPKEVFDYYESDKIIIANISSPQTVENIKRNNN